MLKNVIFSLTVLCLALTSCKKDDDEAKNFDKTKAYGTWEVIGGTDFTPCADGDNQIITITDSQIKVGSVDDDGCASFGAMILDYEYINENSFDGGITVYQITALSETSMNLTSTSPLAPEVSSTLQLTKEE